MFPYADFNFYVEKSHGKLTEEEFETRVLDASFFLRNITLCKSDIQQPEELQYATCAIVNMYAEQSKKAASGAIKAENNDGYSVTYVSEQKEGESFEDLLFRKSLSIAKKYLRTTGLLSRKVEMHNVD